jgi:uncharacterized protein (TIGR02246 family)
MTERPSIDLNLHRAAVSAFVDELQEAIDTESADLFNRRFARDVLWGSPFGAVAPGYDVIHAIHARMFGSVPATPGAARYAIEHVSSPSEDVVVAYVRRTAQAARAEGSGPGAFDELALFVLAKREGEWWLAAAQHVPDRRDVYARPIARDEASER